MSESLVRALLTGADFEVIPLKSVMAQVPAIPTGSTVSVTASPAKGMKATVDLAIELQKEGYRAVPHLSARMIEGRRDLGTIIKRLDDGGVSRAFITGGDGEQRDIYVDALSVLLDMAELGHPFFEVGITGYPEGHPAISADRLRKALLEKQAHATYIVTQMCFNPRTIVDWVTSIRADGVTIPVKVGVPGAVEPARLLTIGARIGVGDSLRFIAKNRRALFRILRPGRFRPDRLIEPLGRLGEGLGLTGLHIFTFNQVGSTIAWHNRAMARLS